MEFYNILIDSYLMNSKGPGARCTASARMTFSPSKNIDFSKVFIGFRAPQGGPTNRLFEVFLAAGAILEPRWPQVPIFVDFLLILVDLFLIFFVNFDRFLFIFADFDRFL